VAFAGDKGNAPAKSAAVYVRATPEAAPSPAAPEGGGVSPGGGVSAR
jgi:hypothetical protein